jgi:hypothetical protein
MWNKILQWCRDLLFGVTPVVPEEEVVPEYVLPEEWPFDGPKPTNAVIHKLNKGLETTGDHIVYRSPETGGYAGVVKWEGQEWLTKVLTFWIAEGRLKEGHTFHTMRSTCDLQRCVHPDHLKPKYLASKDPNAPKPKKATLNINRVAGPPEYKVDQQKAPVTSEILEGDRTKCVSAKVYFETLDKVKEVARLYNDHLRPEGGRKLYGYACDWCSGNHLTKQNPKTRPQYKHKGSWS